MEDKELNIEEDAIRYANTQPAGQWNAAKIGYMAGAQDSIALESPLMMLVSFAMEQIIKGNEFFFNYYGHIKDGGCFTIWGYCGVWDKYKEPIAKFTLNVKDIDLAKATRIIDKFRSEIDG